MTDEELLSKYTLEVKTTVSTPEICSYCNGYGHTRPNPFPPAGLPVSCTTCGGTGVLITVTKEVVARPKGYYKFSPRSYYEQYDPKKATRLKLDQE